MEIRECKKHGLTEFRKSIFNIVIITAFIFFLGLLFGDINTCDHVERMTVGCFKSDYKYECSASSTMNISIYSNYKIFCQGYINLIK